MRINAARLSRGLWASTSRTSPSGSAVLTTDSEGRYRFKTIKPTAYPAGPNRMRPAHIHFQVTGHQDKIVTQMYFENDPYNKVDPFLIL